MIYALAFTVLHRVKIEASVVVVVGGVVTALTYPPRQSHSQW